MFNIYQAALKADAAYEKAIKQQFGNRASRYDHTPSEFNPATAAAYGDKLKADEAWRLECIKLR